MNTIVMFASSNVSRRMKAVSTSEGLIATTVHESSLPNQGGLVRLDQKTNQGESDAGPESLSGTVEISRDEYRALLRKINAMRRPSQPVDEPQPRKAPLVDARSNVIRAAVSTLPIVSLVALVAAISLAVMGSAAGVVASLAGIAAAGVGALSGLAVTAISGTDRPRKDT
ncbi:MAG: hypothetical protein AAGA48_08235 [Myxococcota bacterium]